MASHQRLWSSPIVSLDDATNQKLMEDFQGEKTGFVLAGRDKYLLPAKYAKDAQGYYDFRVKEDDVWLVTFPRSGTTVSQELVWMLMNHFDYKHSAEVPLNLRVPFYEYSILFHESLTNNLINLNQDHPDLQHLLTSWRTPGYVWGKELSSPRIFKTHLPFSLLPPDLDSKSKCIYIARNPKDVLVSYYHHNKLLNVHGYVGDFPTYWNYFKSNLVVYSPYWEHLKEGLARRERENVLFLFYEDLIKDMKREIWKVARFLGKNPSEEDVDKLAEHLRIENFKKNIVIHSKYEIRGRTSNHEQGFIRKGEVGRNQELTPSIENEIREWTQDNLRGTNLTLPWD